MKPALPTASVAYGLNGPSATAIVDNATPAGLLLSSGKNCPNKRDRLCWHPDCLQQGKVPKILVGPLRLPDELRIQLAMKTWIDECLIRIGGVEAYGRCSECSYNGIPDSGFPRRCVVQGLGGGKHSKMR